MTGIFGRPNGESGVAQRWNVASLYDDSEPKCVVTSFLTIG
jgi:hypothetical protein